MPAAALDADGRAQERAKRPPRRPEKKSSRTKAQRRRRGGKAKPDKAAEAATNRASVGQQLGLNLDDAELRAATAGTSATPTGPHCQSAGCWRTTGSRPTPRRSCWRLPTRRHPRRTGRAHQPGAQCRHATRAPAAAGRARRRPRAAPGGHRHPPGRDRSPPRLADRRRERADRRAAAASGERPAGSAETAEGSLHRLTRSLTARRAGWRARPPPTAIGMARS